MANLVKLVNLFFLFFLITSLLFFFYQFSINLISLNAFTKVFLFFILSVAILLYSYKKSKKCFNFIIESIGVNQRIAAPIMMFVFLGGFSIALAITFISFIQALGLLFIVESIESLILNIIALVCFFWLAFILFIGWDFIKISGFASQYTMIVEKRSGFLENMRLANRGDISVSFWKSFGVKRKLAIIAMPAKITAIPPRIFPIKFDILEKTRFITFTPKTEK